jgi:hypothetical protein
MANPDLQYPPLSPVSGITLVTCGKTQWKECYDDDSAECR